MKIAFITTTMKPELNGLSDSVYDRAMVMAEEGHEILILGPDYEIIKEVHPEYKKYQGQIHPSVQMIPYKSNFFKEKSDGCIIKPFFQYSLNPALTEFQPDIIHVEEPYRMTGLKIVDGHFKRPGLSYSRKNNIPITCMWHTNYFKYSEFYLPEAVRFFLVPMARKWFSWIYNGYLQTFSHSLYGKNELEKTGVKNVKHGIYHGVNLKYFFYKEKEVNNSSEGIKLLFAGRIEPEKELAILFDAFDILQKQFKDLKLYIAGSGSMLATLKKRYKKNKDIVFTGRLFPEEMGELYRKSDIFITPSTTETFGNTVIEAAASGLPVIGPKAGGLLDTLQDGINGFWCKPHCSVDMAKKAAKLVKNPELRMKISVTGREMTQKYSHKEAALNMLREFRKLVRARED